jgi:Beta-propeller repeat
MKDLNNKTIRVITTFATLFCLMFSLLATPFAATRQANIFTESTTIPTGLNLTESAAQVKQKIRRNFGNLPLSFEQNQGQTDERVKFLSRSNGYTIFFTETEAVIKTRGENVLQMRFEDANKSPRLEGVEARTHQTNYLKGEEKDWKRNIPNYEKIAYRELYQGVDAIFYGVQKEVEYDFIVAPNADANQIKLSFEGAENLVLDSKGDLHIKVGESEIVQRAPFIYQEIGDERVEIEGKFAVDAEKMTVGFEIGEYDRNQALVIDPRLVYSTYFGGDTNSTSVLGDEIVGIAVDNGGNIFVAGNTTSTDLQTTGGAFQTQLKPGQVCRSDSFVNCGDAFVAKINPAGDDFLYFTYIGGQLNDEVKDLAIGSDGLPVIVGGTDPRVIPTCGGVTNFVATPYPTTGNHFQDAPRNIVNGCLRSTADAFITKLNSTGSGLVYSTYYQGRGDDAAFGVALDSDNNIYVVGQTTSSDLPTKNGFQNSVADSSAGNGDSFIAKFDPSKSGFASFLYGSLIGGADRDLFVDIAVDAAKNAYIVGATASTDILAKSPSSLPPLQANNNGSIDGIIAKIDPTNTSGQNSLVYLTYFGGIERDQIEGVAVEPNTQRAFITGFTDSESDFPLLNAFDSTANETDGFVAKLNADGTTMFYSTLIGGSGSFDAPKEIKIDAAGNAYIFGKTNSNDFPTVNAFQTSNAGGFDAFAAKISAVPNTTTPPQLLWSSYYGGNNAEVGFSMALDKKGQVYLTGLTASTDLFISAVNLKAGAILSDINTDGFIARIESTFNDSVGVYDSSALQFSLRNPLSNGGANATINFGSAGDLPVVGDWNGDGETEMGVYDSTSGQFTLRRKLCPSICVNVSTTVNFGQAGDLPVAGDWDADGDDTIGVYRPSTGQFLLADSLSSNPPITHTVNFTASGNIVPLAGDWNGDGQDTVGFYVSPISLASVGRFQLTNQDAANPTSNIISKFGSLNEKPVAGDWDGDGRDSVGLWSSTSGLFSLTNNNSNIAISFRLQEAGDFPVVGDWDGKLN